MKDLIELLNNTSSNRVVFYCAVFLSAVIVICISIESIIGNFTKK